MQETYRRDKQIIVLGRGRSGTSIVAGLLYYLGVDMGTFKDRNLPRDPNNPKGYFEDEEIMNIVDRYVESRKIGLIHDCPEFEKEFKEYVSKKGGIWGWKQPATIHLLPLIVKYLDNPYFIICEREMESHAKSIQRAFWKGRKDLDWCKQSIKHYCNLLTIFFIGTNYPRLKVQFEKFFENNNQIIKLCDFLNIPFDEEKIEGFIDSQQPKFL